MNKKISIISVISAVIILLGGFIIYEKFIAKPQTSTQNINTKQTQTSGNNNLVPVPPPPAPTGFKDGTYIGNETSSLYGKAKVEIIISAGKITDVQFLEYPNDRAASSLKSNIAMPIIRKEVIQAQSADVNTVSGATETSNSFIQSIISALGQAQAS